MTDSKPIAAQPHQESTDPDTDVRPRLDPDRVLATLHAVMDQPESAVALLTETWRTVPVDVDQAWLHELCDLGAELATTLPTSLLLATAFRHAAQALRTRGHLHLAAVQGMRELAIHRLRDDDPDATAAALHDLAQTYRAQHLPHKVIGCADETLETYLLHHHDTGTAHTLLHLGTLMIEAERYDSAVKYLTRADKLHQHLSNPTEHAHCLANLGRALWQTGNHTTAHRTLNRALSLIIDIDNPTTRSIRALVTTTRQP